MPEASRGLYEMCDLRFCSLLPRKSRPKKGRPMAMYHRLSRTQAPKLHRRTPFSRIGLARQRISRQPPDCRHLCSLARSCVPFFGFCSSGFCSAVLLGTSISEFTDSAYAEGPRVPSPTVLGNSTAIASVGATAPAPYIPPFHRIAGEASFSSSLALMAVAFLTFLRYRASRLPCSFGAGRSVDA